MALDIGDEVDSQNGKTITQGFFLSEIQSINGFGHHFTKVNLKIFSEMVSCL
jgi:hypothetical protein